MHQDLFRQARQLATIDPMKPRRANLCRAVSATYYALFHALVDGSCRMILGASNAEAPYRYVVGRAFVHGVMKQACAAFEGGTLKATVAKGLPATFSIPPEIKLVAGTFVNLQQLRHMADYDRTERFSRSDVLTLIGLAEANLAGFTALPNTIEKKFFLTCLLTYRTLAER